MQLAWASRLNRTRYSSAKYTLYSTIVSTKFCFAGISTAFFLISDSGFHVAEGVSGFRREFAWAPLFLYLVDICDLKPFSLEAIWHVHVCLHFASVVLRTTSSAMKSVAGLDEWYTSLGSTTVKISSHEEKASPSWCWTGYSSVLTAAAALRHMAQLALPIAFRVLSDAWYCNGVTYSPWHEEMASFVWWARAPSASPRLSFALWY